MDDYKKIQEFLKKSDAQIHSWAPKGERVVRYVIHGLDEGMDLDFIREELVSRDIPCLAAKTISPKNKDIYVITVARNEKFNPRLIEEIDNICCHKAKIVAFKYKKPQRCYRCNNYRHGSRFCTVSPRCYYCAGDHEGKDCPRDDPVKCCNCGGDHEAFSSKCEIYKAELERLTNSKENKRIQAKEKREREQRKEHEENRINNGPNDVEKHATFPSENAWEKRRIEFARRIQTTNVASNVNDRSINNAIEIGDGRPDINEMREGADSRPRNNRDEGEGRKKEGKSNECSPRGYH